MSRLPLDAKDADFKDRGDGKSVLRNDARVTAETIKAERPYRVECEGVLLVACCRTSEKARREAKRFSKIGDAILAEGGGVRGR